MPQDEYTYVFTELRTSAPLVEIPLMNVTLSDQQNGVGEIRGDFPLHMSGYINDHLLEASRPGQNGVVVERNGVPIWDGYISSRWYQSQAKLVSIFGKTIKAYPSEVFIRNTFAYADLEQTQLFLNAWSTLQSDPKSNIQVALPSSIATGVLRSESVEPDEFKNWGQVMDNVANGSDGFDWEVQTTKTSGYYNRQLRMGYPTFGSNDSENLMVFDYPNGSVLNYYETENQIATRTFGLGAGSGVDMLVASQADLDSEVNGLRFDRTLAYKEVNNQATLETLTRQAFLQDQPSSNPSVFKVELKADRSPKFGEYHLGDFLKFGIQDSRHPKYVEKILRLTRWELRPPSDQGGEEVNLSFAGAENG